MRLKTKIACEVSVMLCLVSQVHAQGSAPASRAVLIDMKQIRVEKREVRLLPAKANQPRELKVSCRIYNNSSSRMRALNLRLNIIGVNEEPVEQKMVRVTTFREPMAGELWASVPPRFNLDGEAEVPITQEMLNQGPGFVVDFVSAETATDDSPNNVDYAITQFLTKGPDELRRLLKINPGLAQAQTRGGLGLVYFAWYDGSGLSLEELFKRGATVNARSSFGQTPLMYAAQFPTVEGLKRLVVRNSDVRAKDKSGRTALDYASFHNHFYNTRFLLEMGLDPNATSEKGTTLCSSIESRAFECTRELLRAGADPNRSTNGSLSPVCLAVKNGDVASLELLFRNGADLNKEVNEMYPIQAAAVYGQEACAYWLIQHGANAYVANSKYGDPVVWATRYYPNVAVCIDRERTRAKRK